MKGHLAFQKSASNGTRLTHMFHSNTNVPVHDRMVEMSNLFEAILFEAVCACIGSMNVLTTFPNVIR